MEDKSCFAVGRVGPWEMYCCSMFKSNMESKLLYIGDGRCRHFGNVLLKYSKCIYTQVYRADDMSLSSVVGP